MSRISLVLLLAVLPALSWAETFSPVLQDREGNPINVQQSQKDGKHVVFVFWQSWCGACKKEAPDLVEASHQWAAKAQFVGVVSGSDKNIDERRVSRFIETAGLDYPQVRDRDLSLTHAFNVKGTPTIIVIDPQGRVVYRGHHAPDDWTEFLGS